MAIIDTEKSVDYQIFGGMKMKKNILVVILVLVLAALSVSTSRRLHNNNRLESS